MDTVEACSSQNSSVNKPNEDINKNKWEYLIKTYQIHNSTKYRGIIQNTVIKILRSYGYNIVEPGRFAVKHGLSKPYYLFFTRVDASEETYNQQYSITFPEILDRSLGEIVNSLHLNFMVDVTWLCLQYVLAGQRIDMTILYGDKMDQTDFGDNIITIQVEKPSDFGCHHTKIMILQYKCGGIRVVVSTANLFDKEWTNKTQGLWISPYLPPLPESADSSEGESATHFKKDLGQYLRKYKNPALQQWIKIVKRTDFSNVKVFLIASVPGCYKYYTAPRWGHRKLSLILSHYAVLPADAPQWPLVAQSSSIGKLGEDYKSWLKEIVFSMSRGIMQTSTCRNPKFQFIYPSLENYRRSHDYIISERPCLSYSLEVHDKQKWIESYLYQWRAKRTGRDRAMPHIKCYTRISPDLKSIPWFVLTSANLSKAAWGVKGGYGRKRGCHINNYEVGVVFLPKFITETETFPIQHGTNSGVPIFPFIHDLPLHQYKEWDKPLITREFIRNRHQRLASTTIE